MKQITINLRTLLSVLIFTTLLLSACGGNQQNMPAETVSSEENDDSDDADTNLAEEQEQAEIEDSDAEEATDDPAQDMTTSTTSAEIHPISDDNATNVSVLAELDSWPRQVLVSPSSDLLAAAVDNELQIWDLNTFQLKASFAHNYDVHDMVFSPDGKFLALRQAIDSQIWLWNVQEERLARAVENIIGKAVFSPDSRWLAVAVDGLERPGIFIWDIQNQSQRIILLDARAEISDISPSGQFLLLHNSQGLEILDLQTEELTQIYGKTDNEKTLRVDYDALFNQQGDKVIAFSEKDAIHVIDVTSQAILYDLAGKRPVLNPMIDQFAYLAQTQQFPYYALRFVDVESGVEQSVEGEIEFIKDMGFSPDGRVLAVAKGDQGSPSEVQIWDTSGTLLSVLEGHVFSPVSVSFSADGKMLASAGSEILVWGTHTPTENPPPPTAASPATVEDSTSTIIDEAASSEVYSLAFHTGDFDRGDNDFEIAMINSDLSGFQILTNDRGVANVNPSWSPDGSQIVYQSERDGNSEIYLMLADGSMGTRLTANRNFDGGAFWSEDGSKIYFTSDRDGEYQLYEMNPDGTDQVLSRNGEFDLNQGALSNDGSLRLFQSEWDGELNNFEIFISDAAGENVRQLTDNSYADYWPTWSTDNSQIFFISNRDGFEQLYVMNIDGSDVKNVSNTFSGVIEYALSPDGKVIAFTSDWQLYFVNVDGNGLMDVGIGAAGLSWSKSSSTQSTENDETSAIGDPTRGEALYKQTLIAQSAPGCITCHSLDAGAIIVGPSHAGVKNRAGSTVDGLTAEEYLRQSIIDPNAFVVGGFVEGIMYQNYAQELSDSDINDLVAFLLEQ